MRARGLMWNWRAHRPSRVSHQASSGRRALGRAFARRCCARARRAVNRGAARAAPDRARGRTRRPSGRRRTDGRPRRRGVRPHRPQQPRPARARGRRARPARLGEPLHPVRLAHSGREGRAGNPRRRHLEQGFPDPIAVSDPDRLGAEAREGQVLAERPGRRRAAELLPPPGVVLGAVDVDRLVGAAVVLLVRDDVAGKAKRPDVAPLDRRLADPGRDRAGADLISSARPAFTESTRIQRAAGSKRSLARFRLSGTLVG